MLEELKTDYDFKLCTSASELCEAYRLRIEVFHEEQKFSKELEVDEYDPVSAHFLLVTKKDKKAAATVRLSPYHLANISSSETQTINTLKAENDLPLGMVRNESSIIQDFIVSLKSAAIRGDDPKWLEVKLARLAVTKTMRNKGLGALTVRLAEDWLVGITSIFQDKSNLGVDRFQHLSIFISSQALAQGFYEKLSYVPEGEPYYEEEVLHMLCTKRIF